MYVLIQQVHVVFQTVISWCARVIEFIFINVISSSSGIGVLFCVGIAISALFLAFKLIRLFVWGM